MPRLNDGWRANAAAQPDWSDVERFEAFIKGIRQQHFVSNPTWQSSPDSPVFRRALGIVSTRRLKKSSYKFQARMISIHTAIAVPWRFLKGISGQTTVVNTKTKAPRCIFGMVHSFPSSAATGSVEAPRISVEIGRWWRWLVARAAKIAAWYSRSALLQGTMRVWNYPHSLGVILAGIIAGCWPKSCKRITTFCIYSMVIIGITEGGTAIPRKLVGAPGIATSPWNPRHGDGSIDSKLASQALSTTRSDHTRGKAYTTSIIQLEVDKSFLGTYRNKTLSCTTRTCQWKVHHLHVSEAMEMFQLQELVPPATNRSGSESLFIGARKQWRFQGSHGRIPVVAFGFWPCRCPAGPLRCLSRGYQKWTEAGTFHGRTRNVRCECNWVPLAGTLPLRSTMFECVWTLYGWKAWKYFTSTHGIVFKYLHVRSKTRPGAVELRTQSTAWIQVANLLKDPDNPDFKDSTASIPTCYTHSNLEPHVCAWKPVDIPKKCWSRKLHQIILL